jgi:hypothetical protein
MMCNKTQNVDKAMALKQQLIDMGHQPAPDVYVTILNMACGQGPGRWPDVRKILDCMDHHGIPLGEAGVSSLIRLHVASGDARAALAMLADLESQSEQKTKRRHILPVLEGACEAGDGKMALRLVDMFRRNDIPFQEEEFVALVTLCGHPGQEHKMGLVLNEMRQVVYRVGPRLRSKLEAWFTAHRWLLHQAVVSPSGVCSQCGGQLAAVHATASSVRRIKSTMEQMMLDDLDGKSRSHELLHNSNIFRNGTPQGLRGANLLKKFKVWLQDNG